MNALEYAIATDLLPRQPLIDSYLFGSERALWLVRQTRCYPEGSMATVDEARKKLMPLLADLAALKPFIDVGNPAALPFQEAFAIAREKAIAAAREYAEALRA